MKNLLYIDLFCGAGENSETSFEYFYGNWCYEYTVDEYNLENKYKL